MLKAIYVINNEPIPVVAKLQRGNILTDVCDEICGIIRNHPDPTTLQPIINNPNHTYCIKKSGEVWLVAQIDGDGEAMLYISILDQIEELLHLYVEKPLTDFGVKDNFAIIYRLLDIFVDCGYPLVDDFNGMIQFIPKPGFEKGQPNLVQPWRANNITYKKQQVLLDVSEYFDYCVAANGKIDLQQIRGEIQMLAEINGNPKCSFSWKNAPLFEDVAFHRCVDLTNFQTARRLELIPPHGSCFLAQYRMQQNQLKPPLEVKVALVPTLGKIDIRLTTTSIKELSNVTIKFAIDSPTESTLITKNGSINNTGDEFVWNIGYLKQNASVELSGTVNCDQNCKNVLFRVDFDLLKQLISGCEMGTVLLDGGDKDVFIGAKYESHCGKYQIRAGTTA
ncbi:Adaptor complexes medium subunit family protein [Tritrichomonas foetus]|uniref:Adaptor complexes medium subunit family protein n=1 Tax=Tritrichomonas foetus TaxID=1144522 RepID=A0A1J4KYY6_9EUKA|nr:Adaptor complexes medium subunit family protein [Tritrichomonas foetus]|eukprot:OHT16463.1 Adaptor complexes medium subunit family protein [Tritrichomonas foetus]